MSAEAPAATFDDLCAQMLGAGRPVRFKARGPSMSPAIRDGESVLVKPVDLRAIGPGDVILYRSPRGLTAHRVVAGLPGDEPGWRVRGDAPGSEEERVAAEQVLGRVEAVRRNGLDQPVRSSVETRSAFLGRFLRRPR